MNALPRFRVVAARGCAKFLLRATRATPLALLVLGGCVNPLVYDGARQGPFFVPSNHVGAPSLTGIRRVLMLPVWGGELAPPETVAELDRVLQAALMEQNRFEVVALGRPECRARFGAEALASSAALPPDFLNTIQREFAAEAVLFIDLTAFSAYQPLTIGLRAKLAPVGQGWLAWAFDEVFSAANPAIANSARRHLAPSDGARPGDGSLIVPLHSPSRFASYAASAMFSTLPPVRTAVAITPSTSTGSRKN